MIPYTTLGYMNGPGWYKHRLDQDGKLIQETLPDVLQRNDTIIARVNLTDVDTGK